MYHHHRPIGTEHCLFFLPSSPRVRLPPCLCSSRRHLSPRTIARLAPSLVPCIFLIVAVSFIGTNIFGIYVCIHQFQDCTIIPFCTELTLNSNTNLKVSICPVLYIYLHCIELFLFNGISLTCCGSYLSVWTVTHQERVASYTRTHFRILECLLNYLRHFLVSFAFFSVCAFMANISHSCFNVVNQEQWAAMICYEFAGVFFWLENDWLFYPKFWIPAHRPPPRGSKKDSHGPHPESTRARWENRSRSPFVQPLEILPAINLKPSG